MSHQTGIIAGTLNLPDGTPLTGRVEVIPNVSKILDASGEVVLLGRAKADLVNGSFTVTVPASNDATLNPTGVTYIVVVKGHNASGFTVTGVNVPAGTTVQLADVTNPDPTAPGYALQVTRVEFDTLKARVDAGGGGGGGAVASVNSKTGAVVLSAADVGADPAGSSSAAQSAAVAAAATDATTKSAAAQAAAIAAAAADATGKANAAQSAATTAAASDATTKVNAHAGNASNPHSVTKSQVGLGNVDNTSDANKPVSTAQATAIGAKADTSALTAHTGNTANPHATTKAQVGLGNVDNTADVDKPVSTAQAAAIATKAPVLAPTSTKATAYTVAVGELAMMNVAGGATTLTLPTAPADKAQVGYRAIGATTAAPLTINVGAGDTIGTSGATTATIPLADETAVLQYVASTKQWLGVSNIKTQSSLDARYATPTAVAGRADAAGAWRDLVRAAQLGYSHTAAVLSDSTADNLAGATEWPLLSLKLLATQYPGVRMEHYQFDDPTQLYGSATVVNAGAAAGGGTVADDGFSGTGNAVGASADTAGTWQGGTGTVTKSSGTASPSANSGLAFLAPSQDAKATLDMIVTTAGFTGGAQAYRVGTAYTNAGLSGFGLQAILTLTSATSTTLTIRKYINGGTLTTISSETLDFGLNNVTAQAASLSIELLATNVTVTLIAGATTTTRTFSITTADYAGLGSYVGAASSTTVGAMTWDRLRVITPVIPTPTIKLYNGSVAGKNADYPRPRLAAIMPTSMDSLLMSYGHNGNLITGGVTGFMNDYQSTVDAVKAAQPNATIYIGSQNPEFPPADSTKVADHKARQARLRAFAVTNGLKYVPVFEAFTESATDNGLSLVQSDGVHPTNPPGGTPTDGYGSTLWARTITGITAAVTSGISQTAADARYEQLTAGNPGVVCPLAAGAWYPAGPVMQHLNQIPPEANEQCTAFIAGRTTTLTGLAIQVTTAGTTGALVRLGIRADNGSGKPGTLLQDAGTIDGTTIGVKSVTVSVPVTAGTRYWVTATVQGAATTRPTLVSLYNLSAPTFPAANATDSLANTNYGWRVSGVTGALGASFTPDNMAGSTAKIVLSAAT